MRYMQVACEISVVAHYRDYARVWKEAGYLESLRSATSIYSVHHTLMHMRMHVCNYAGRRA